MRLFTRIKIRLRKAKPMIYSDNIYCNYSHFYNALFNNKIKSVKQMRKILIKIIEKSYNKKIKTNKPAMMIFDEERHKVNVYWNEYFMRTILKLKYIFDEPKELCRKFRTEQRKYKQWDEYIDKFNEATASYSQLLTDKKLYTKKYKLQGDLLDNKKN